MKRPKVKDKPIPSAETVAKRASSGGNVLKMEKDKTKFSTGENLYFFFSLSLSPFD